MFSQGKETNYPPIVPLNEKCSPVEVLHSSALWAVQIAVNVNIVESKQHLELQSFWRAI